MDLPYCAPVSTSVDFVAPRISTPSAYQRYLKTVPAGHGPVDAVSVAPALSVPKISGQVYSPATLSRSTSYAVSSACLPTVTRVAVVKSRASSHHSCQPVKNSPSRSPP